MLLGYLGIDQHGNRFKIDAHPRKELCEQLGRRHAEKMYVDCLSGGTRHTGYVIAGLWVTVYEVHRWNEPQGEDNVQAS